MGIVQKNVGAGRQVSIPDHYIQKIRSVYPDTALNQLEFNQDGMNNDVVIVNQELVCRFPKNDWAKEELKFEVKVLEAARRFIDLPIPCLECVQDDFISYSLIRGEALSRHQLFRLDSPIQEKVIEQLGVFLQQLHSIPADAIAESNIPPSLAERSRDDMIALYEQVQEILFPYFWKHQKIWIHEHFEPLINGTLTLNSSSTLIHGDLGCYHILFDSDRQCLSGIIDFGTAGVGNPAIDLAVLLDSHGEAIVKRISKYYPAVEFLIDQARFRAGVTWLQWALLGVQNQDTGLLLAHVGSSARDIQPLGASF